MHITPLHVLLLNFFLSLLEALPFNHTNDQIEAPIDAGSFKNPSANVRPRYRYWLPDASVNTTLLANDIKDLGERGAGGVELLNYFMYGGLMGNGAPTDWNIYGYGTPAYREVLTAVLQAHRDHGLIMDFSMGPQSGQGVPAEPHEVGLAYNLVSFNKSLQAGKTYQGQLPGWGHGEFVSAVAFATINTTDVTAIITDFPPAITFAGGVVNTTVHTIASSSLVDVSEQLQPDGTIELTVPSVENAIEYYLFAHYYERSYERACIASSEHPQNIFQNGSFAVDHFSAAGAQLTIDFLEKYVLIDEIRELLKEVGNYIWEDSVEIESHQYWTPSLSRVFEEQHGYLIEPHIPLLAGRNGEVQKYTGIGSDFFILDTDDQGAGIVGDWRQTMTTLLGTYYDTFVNWTNSYLDLQFSGQVGYNLPVDMLSVISHVNAPETESLSFSNNIDSFRQYVGPAHLAGKRVIPMEVGSDYLQTYTQTWKALLKDAKRAFLTGVNQAILHGAPYSHKYPNTTWPGYTSFSYAFAGHHSRHQPAWDVGYAAAGMYLARTQHILQSGVPEVDLVFWDKRTAERAYPETLYWPSDLTEAGYTYSYLSPDSFGSDRAIVSNGVLAPESQAFRALIIRGNDTLTISGIEALSQYADAGLPIIIAGGLPGQPIPARQLGFLNGGSRWLSSDIPSAWNTNNSSGIAYAQALLQSILDLPNVHQVPAEALAESVATIGIHPRTRVTTDHAGVWITHWRENANGDVHVFVYNDGNTSTGTISFQTTSPPVFLDAWSGEELPFVAYVCDEDLTTISLTLECTETVIIKFAASASRRVHLQSTKNLINSLSAAQSSVIARVSAGDQAVLLSNGSQIMIPGPIPEPITLHNWTIVIEEWNAPDDLFDVEIVANKTNVTFTVVGTELPAWLDLSESLMDTSGIGHYNASFHWSLVPWLGAVLVLPPIDHGINLFINGISLPPVDITHPVVDISKYLVEGENTLSASVSSTLWNVVRPIWSELETGGSSPAVTVEELTLLGLGQLQAYGIVGEVKINPYFAVTL